MEKELKTILYVEDEEDIRSIAQIALEDIGGFTLKNCTNGEEALAAAESFVPDLILLDVMMPGMDGPTTLNELRKNPKFSNIPAIFITAKIQADEISEYKSLGALDVISKPFDPITLAAQIKEIWSR